MKKIITITLVVSIFASVLLLAGGCAIFDSTNSVGMFSPTGGFKEQDVSEFVWSLCRDGATSSYLNAINYKIDYQWKDINFDIIDASFFEYVQLTKEEVAADIIRAEECKETIYVSEYYESNFEDRSISSSYASIKDIDKKYSIVYNEGHKSLVKENEMLIPKWLYYTFYCATLSEIYCDKDTVERILSDGQIAQKYMFFGFTDFWDINSKDSVYFDYHLSLPIALSYYGLLDTTASKDMTIYAQGIYNPHVGQSGKPHELSIVGYYETATDKLFESAITEDVDCNELFEYLIKMPVMYFK